MYNASEAYAKVHEESHYTLTDDYTAGWALPPLKLMLLGAYILTGDVLDLAC
jgi:hypothetical protein